MKQINEMKIAGRWFNCPRNNFCCLKFLIASHPLPYKLGITTHIHTHTHTSHTRIHTHASMNAYVYDFIKTKNSFPLLQPTESTPWPWFWMLPMMTHTSDHDHKRLTPNDFGSVDYFWFFSSFNMDRQTVTYHDLYSPRPDLPYPDLIHLRYKHRTVALAMPKLVQVPLDARPLQAR